MKPEKQPRQSVFAEAWQNMSGDMERLLPRKLQGRRGKFIFSLGLALVELILLGVVGKFLYQWWQQ